MRGLWNEAGIPTEHFELFGCQRIDWVNLALRFWLQGVASALGAEGVEDSTETRYHTKLNLSSTLLSTLIVQHNLKQRWMSRPVDPTPSNDSASSTFHDPPFLSTEFHGSLQMVQPLQCFVVFDILLLPSVCLTRQSKHGACQLRILMTDEYILCLGLNQLILCI